VNPGEKPHAGRPLPPPPQPELHLLEDRTADSRCDEGFLRLHRGRYQLQWPDGERSAPFAYDTVRRRALDAVAIVLWRREPGRAGASLLLRSAVRPPLWLRRQEAVPLRAELPVAQWEVPAGLVEPTERGEAGLRRCAARETLEETGLRLPPEAFALLGPPVLPTAGVLGEMVWFLAAEVPAQAGAEPPRGDGSPLEARAELRWLPLEAALEAARAGALPDSKTELAVRRLLEARPWEAGP